MVTRTKKGRLRISKYKIEESEKKNRRGKGSGKGRNGKEYKRKRADTVKGGRHEQAKTVHRQVISA